MKIAIVGAAGKMGSWFAVLLHRHGHELVLVGRRREPVERLALGMERCTVGAYDSIGGADAVIVSVPLNVVDDVLRELAPYVKESQPVIDLSSLKVAPQASAETHMPKACFLGVHPMFGPGADGFAGHNVILVPGSAAAAALADRVRAYVEPLGAHVTSVEPAEHDALMSIVLGLPALAVAAVARTILSTGRLTQARETSGTSLEVLMALTESMVCGGSELYGTLLAAMPAAPSVAASFQDSAGHLAKLVAEGDRSSLIAEFETLGRGLTECSRTAGDAYARMYAMLEALKRYPATPSNSR